MKLINNIYNYIIKIDTVQTDETLTLKAIDLYFVLYNHKKAYDYTHFKEGEELLSKIIQVYVENPTLYKQILKELPKENAKEIKELMELTVNLPIQIYAKLLDIQSKLPQNVSGNNYYQLKKIITESNYDNAYIKYFSTDNAIQKLENISNKLPLDSVNISSNEISNLIKQYTNVNFVIEDLPEINQTLFNQVWGNAINTVSQNFNHTVLEKLRQYETLRVNAINPNNLNTEDILNIANSPSADFFLNPFRYNIHSLGETSLHIKETLQQICEIQTTTLFRFEDYYFSLVLAANEIKDIPFY